MAGAITLVSPGPSDDEPSSRRSASPRLPSAITGAGDAQTSVHQRETRGALLVEGWAVLVGATIEPALVPAAVERKARHQGLATGVRGALLELVTALALRAGIAGAREVGDSAGGTSAASAASHRGAAAAGGTRRACVSAAATVRRLTLSQTTAQRASHHDQAEGVRQASNSARPGGYRCAWRHGKRMTHSESPSLAW